MQIKEPYSPKLGSQTPDLVRFRRNLNESKLATESFHVISSILNKFEINNCLHIDYGEVVGPTFTYIDAAASFFCSTFITLTYFVHNLVLGLLTLFIAPFNERAKNFCVIHFCRAGLDLFIFATSVVGTVAPAIAFDMFGSGMQAIDQYFQEDLKKYINEEVLPKENS